MLRLSIQAAASQRNWQLRAAHAVVQMHLGSLLSQVTIIQAAVICRVVTWVVIRAGVAPHSLSSSNCNCSIQCKRDRPCRTERREKISRAAASLQPYILTEMRSNKTTLFVVGVHEVQNNIASSIQALAKQQHRASKLVSAGKTAAHPMPCTPLHAILHLCDNSAER
jgi:hypothetical protein